MSLSDSDDEALADWGLVEPRWFQIARPVFSPYELELHTMVEASAEEREVANAFENELCLKANVSKYPPDFLQLAPTRLQNSV